MAVSEAIRISGRREVRFDMGIVLSSGNRPAALLPGLRGELDIDGNRLAPKVRQPPFKPCGEVFEGGAVGQSEIEHAAGKQGGHMAGEWLSGAKRVHRYLL